MYTPWGAAQVVTELAAGITFVSTAGHGGVKLDAAHNRRMPEYMRRLGGWYEEDCDWCLPFVVFEAELRAGGESFAVQAIEKSSHVQTFLSWHPDAYEKYYGVTIQQGQSRMRDERDFYRRHARDWLVISAFGDWHARVPQGSVGVCARMGGREGQGPEKWFLVPQQEYDSREHDFIIDPGRHPEIESIQ
jgi:hypothetical protein